MSIMSMLDAVSITPTNFTNGAVAPYKVQLKSSVMLKSGDQLFLTLPDELSVPGQLNCTALDQPVGVKQAQCSNVANKIQVSLIELVKGLGQFEFLIWGIRNPSSFRPTKPLSYLYL